MDAAQFQQLLQQLQQGLAPLANPPQQPQAAFALTPGRANPAQPINYTTTVGSKIYEQATEALPFKFNAEAKEVNAFREKLMERAEKQGWNIAGADVLTIPDTNGTNFNIINEYGRLSFEEIRNHVSTYAAAESRQAQNNNQMYHCIMNSLTKDGQTKILSEQDKYHTGQGNDRRPSGPLLFKLLMQKAVIDTRATASLLRENLSSLDTYMSTINSNVKEFNLYVKTNYEGLRARGERCDDIMINLFKGYVSASDSEFVRYIRAKKDKYEDGEDLTPEQLMTFALNKYETLVKDGRWNAKSAEQEQIVALTAEVKELKDNNLKLARTITSRTSNSRRSGNQQQRGNNQNRNRNNRGNSNNRSNNRSNRRTDKWAWKKVPPKDNESHTKTVNGKTYHWCDEHLAWIVHHPDPNRTDGCSLKKQRLEAEGNQGDSDNRQGALANALTSIITDIQDDAQQE